MTENSQEIIRLCRHQENNSITDMTSNLVYLRIK